MLKKHYYCCFKYILEKNFKSSFSELKKWRKFQDSYLLLTLFMRTFSQRTLFKRTLSQAPLRPHHQHIRRKNAIILRCARCAYNNWWLKVTKVLINCQVCKEELGPLNLLEKHICRKHPLHVPTFASGFVSSIFSALAKIHNRHVTNMIIGNFVLSIYVASDSSWNPFVS